MRHSSFVVLDMDLRKYWFPMSRLWAGESAHANWKGSRRIIGGDYSLWED